jgi:hypothetical protein
MVTDKGRRRRSAADRRKARRYGRRHREARALFEPMVAAGLARCARCGELIEPGAAWDLGHDDVYPELHSGPEHPRCNRAAPHQLSTSRAW